MDDFRDQLAAEFAPYQILSEVQIAILESHYDLLCKWNKKINLCRFKDRREAVQFHYCESLFLGRFLPPGHLRIADAGAGAGFPGFPVAVLRSDCEVDLIESDQRKAAFLREACHSLRNVQVFAGRAEDCTKRYDWVISRAVRADAVPKFGLAANGGLLTSESGDAQVPWGHHRFIKVFHVEL
ncbi:MAG TPA: 16S rRNA (guanine(527)-N(7))-methyltransferase RsmG [Bryobacteraceae bacterium]|nr:16S rRNA (guanine(527)-N(7))-methyltransferase RsmG [Bryobacteraceae bacterium]